MSLRLLVVGLLVLVLLIPARLISAPVAERQTRKEEAINEVASKWAIMAAVMYLTRHVDLYSIETKREQETDGGPPAQIDGEEAHLDE